MKKRLHPAPAPAPAQQPAASTDPLQASPRQVAQRARIAAAFGPTTPVVQRTKWLYVGGTLQDTADPQHRRQPDASTPHLGEGDTWDDQTHVVTHARSRLDAIFSGQEVYPEIRPKELPSVKEFSKTVGGGAVPQSIDYEDVRDKVRAVFSVPENRIKLSGTIRKSATIEGVRALLFEMLPPPLRKAALNDGQFAWHLMRVVNEMAFGVQVPLINADIGGLRHGGEDDIAQTPAYRQIDAFRWSVRHYTDNPRYTDLKSSVELEVLDNIKGKNTRDKDWNKLGNTAFGFYLLAIDGTVGQRGFLSKMTHYAEFMMDALPGRIFVSGDLLEIDQQSIQHVQAYAGAGASVRRELVRLLAHLFKLSGEKGLPTPQWCMAALEGQMQMLEVKVPQALQVAQWNAR